MATKNEGEHIVEQDEAAATGDEGELDVATKPASAEPQPQAQPQPQPKAQPAPQPDPEPTLPAHAPGWFRSLLGSIPDTFRAWFRDPDFSIWFVVYMGISALLFMRPWWGSAASGLGGGWVFDEQEAIVANPYIRSAKFGWWDALRRDFWGLPPDHSIGSYRPIPDFLWRGLWKIQITDRRYIAGWALGVIGAIVVAVGIFTAVRTLLEEKPKPAPNTKVVKASPIDVLVVPAVGLVMAAVGFWLVRGSGGPAEVQGTSPSNVAFVWFNVVFHATNAALLASLVRLVSKRVALAWLAGFVFCTCAVLTEAITGVVGIADVLGGLSLLLALYAIALHPAAVGPAVFLATAFGLLSKETAVVNVGLVPLAALLMAPSIAPARPWRWTRAIAALVGASAALGFYFWVRHKYFFVEVALDEKLAHKWHGVGAQLAKLRHWVGAPDLPADPFNNPLADPNATDAQRIGGALRVYARGVWQIVFPRTLSPDYSSPQEPLPVKPWFPESIAGALLMVGPPLVGAWLALKTWRNEKGGDEAKRAELRLLAWGLLAWPAAFFPVSNIPKILPTVRAERFWYTPAIATSLVLAIAIVWLSRRKWEAGVVAAIAFVAMQAGFARKHANHFRDDLAFWKAAAEAVPNSAKAHLNYSVMLGARAGELLKYTPQQAQEARLVENIRATELAPHWDMAFIYVGDTLCQLGRYDEAWDWYAKGFRIGPANTGLIALALQCLSDHQQLLPKETEARAVANEEAMRGTWYAYLVDETFGRERKCRGVDVEPELEPEEDEEPTAALTVEPADPLARSAEPLASASTSASSSASATASTSSSLSASASSAAIEASASASGEPSAMPGEHPKHEKAKKPKPAPTNTDCGVAPKWRPRGLDQGPQE